MAEAPHRPPTPPRSAAHASDIFDAIASVRRTGEPAALATVVATRGSTPGKETMRLLVFSDGSTIGTVGGGCVEADVVAAALDALEEATPTRHTFRLTENATGASGLMCGGELDVLVEPIGVAVLYVFGAGHISRDLATIATRAGFHVTVLDDRALFANGDRFPDAHRIIAGESFQACFDQADVQPYAYCVVVTRGHAFDLECTRFALSRGARYVGLIGSKNKVTRIVRTLGREGVLTHENRGTLHAPIGLDLGGPTHGEIAVSIVAELIAQRRGTLSAHQQKRLDMGHAIRGDVIRVDDALRGEEGPHQPVTPNTETHD